MTTTLWVGEDGVQKYFPLTKRQKRIKKDGFSVKSKRLYFKNNIRLFFRTEETKIHFSGHRQFFWFGFFVFKFLVTQARQIPPPPWPRKSTKSQKSNLHKKPKKNIQALRDVLPNLSHHSDEVLQSLPWSALFRLNSSLETNGKSGKKLSVNMQKNLEKIKKKNFEGRSWWGQ